MGQKRRRLALSCVACRRRKVKCDRTYPTCVRCQKGGVTCDYVSYTSKQDNTLPTPSEESPHLQREASVTSWTEDANVWHARSQEHEHVRAHNDATNSSTAQPRLQTRTIQELQTRVFELESYVRAAAGSRPISSEKCLGMGHPTGSGTSTDKNALQDFERALLRGKSFKTQYFGPSHGASLLLQFEELSRMAKDTLQRLSSLDKSRYAFKLQRHDVSSSLVLPDFETLVSLVPERTRADALVREYFETLETTHRVLHAPTFFRRYKDFWASSPDSSAAFLVQLLLVCASVNSVVPGGATGFIGRNTVARDTSLKWIEVCESWLDLQSQKHMTLDVFQVQVLLVIAKRLNCVKVKREWTVAGHLLRLAMSAGLHREPTFLSKNIGVFDQEMRRRLWFTILELETQASLDRGMGASLGPFDWDTLAPLNIHDEDFDPSTEKMPPARPITEFTRTSFLCLAQQHLPLRLEMLSRINSIRVTLESETAVELDQRIRQLLDNLPKWSNNAAQAMSQALSELLLYEFLLLVHQPLAAQAGAQARHFYSRAALRNAALATIKTYTKMRPSTSSTLTSLRDDLFRAGLSLCHDIVVSVSSKEELMQDKTTAMQLIDQAVDMMENRIRNLGQGFHSYWLTCSALGLVRSKTSPTKTADELAQETADRVIRLHDYMMAQQIAPPGQHMGKGVEDVAMSAANTLEGVSRQPAPSHPLPELDPFTPIGGSFNTFSETLFDFDITDIWNLDGSTHFQ
ncbi:uncharacterized protein Z518_08800 [Rhinocladiella mackenziei CBS 650.93]|uniref:Rhinocladiella mackenziei CBS 650.93 unplaced genomic scaffold supercont1.6, whole genome shotgun sequence n=1 Tax=Rhinocladiella mackenziei CBS 650.93 TaxID=1442369 RepID=A0A0D2FLI7_9EURO|nr:uncharacterized protein Z518_08800 [Rhinocladiella mackenziei CBS 650.93]KIX02857.1 hypothetical protein Z518_08800 [Rhinocladiella mackenziei CBS 650.93]